MYDDQTHAIIGAAMEVHRQLGPGFLEPVYQAALELEFAERGIPFARQLEVPIFYKGQQLNVLYKPDFICCQEIIIELKALKAITNVELAQVLNYLKASHFQRGLIINFGTSSLEFKRVIWSQHSKADTTEFAKE